jgi:2Fe-2S ferredoxin
MWNPVKKLDAHARHQNPAPSPSTAPQGAEITAPAGTSICEALLDNHINIEHACDMSCACTTCHVIVREGFMLAQRDGREEEEDLLDRAWGLEPQSRLSCQAILAQQNLVSRSPSTRSTTPRKTTDGAPDCLRYGNHRPVGRERRPHHGDRVRGVAATASSPGNKHCTCTSTRSVTATKRAPCGARHQQ